MDLLFLIDINHSELHFINKKGEELRNTIFGSPNEMEASKLIKLSSHLDWEPAVKVISKETFQAHLEQEQFHLNKPTAWWESRRMLWKGYSHLEGKFWHVQPRYIINEI